MIWWVKLAGTVLSDTLFGYTQAQFWSLSLDELQFSTMHPLATRFNVFGFGNDIELLPLQASLLLYLFYTCVLVPSTTG